MKVRNNVLIIIILMTSMLPAQEKDSASLGEINAKAIWGLGMEMMHAIHDSCDSMKYPSFGDCFLEQMKKFGAPSEAVEFTKLTNSEGFMRDFKETGKVDVAYAVYPFRANENQICFLVNGNPNMIDVDNYDYISKTDVKKNIIYKQIAKKYPQISIWPGDRSGMDYPAVRELPEGGQQFIFNYRLQDGCHACKLIGFANLGFNFNKAGKFLGIEVINTLKLKESGKEFSIPGEYSNPDKIIRIKAGQSFTIALKSNATTGYSWQLAESQNEKILNYAGKVYLPPKNAMPGAGGKEEWTFVTNNAGNTEISFKYVRPWEKNMKPAKEAIFKIIVE